MNIREQRKIQLTLGIPADPCRRNAMYAKKSKLYMLSGCTGLTAVSLLLYILLTHSEGQAERTLIEIN